MPSRPEDVLAAPEGGSCGSWTDWSKQMVSAAESKRVAASTRKMFTSGEGKGRKQKHGRKQGTAEERQERGAKLKASQNLEAETTR